MKKSIKSILILLVTVGLFTACSKKDTPTPKPDNKTLIIGIWKLTKISQYFQENGSTKRLFVQDEKINPENSFEFTKEGKAYSKTSSNVSSFDYTIKDNILTTTSTRNAGKVIFTIAGLDKFKLTLEQVYQNQEYNGKKGISYRVMLFQKQ